MGNDSPACFYCQSLSTVWLKNMITKFHGYPVKMLIFYGRQASLSHQLPGLLFHQCPDAPLIEAILAPDIVL